LRIMAGPDGIDLGVEPATLGDAAAVRLDQLTVVDVAGNGVTPVHPELMDAQRRAADALGDAGARIRRVRFGKLRRSFDIWSATLGSSDPQSFSVLLGNGRPTRGALELFK